MVVLRYHVYGNLTIDFINIGMAFPASIVNETLTALSGLHNPNDALIMGVYVNGRLIAVNTSPNPIYGLRTTVSQFNGHIAVAYTSDATTFPPINLTSGDVITVLIYSAVPYALPSCAVTNESGEAGLMVEEHVISAKLYEEGRYITEEPVIYIINTTNPMSQLSQELTPGLLASARPFAIGYAPSFGIGQALLPTVGNSS